MITKAVILDSSGSNEHKLWIELKKTKGSYSMNKYYVYTHTRIGDALPFYVGKGFGKRAYRTSYRSKYWRNVAKDGYDVRIEITDLSEDEAFQLEREIIKTYGRRDLGTGCLVNLTDGGEGPSGYIKSDDHKRKISEAAKGKTRSEKTKQKISDAKKGKTQSEEHKRKLSQSKKGKTLSDDHKRKISDAKAGKTRASFSDDTKRKMSEKAKERWARRKEKN